MAPERVIVLGAGAIGCATAAALVEQGERVLMVARGAACRAIRAGGIDVRTPAGGRRVPVEVVATVREAAPAEGDLVALAVMGQHTAEAIADVPREVPVASFQNGLEPLDVLTRRGHPVIACMVWVPAERRAPGEVALVGAPYPGVVLMGPWGAPSAWLDSLANVLVSALVRGGFRAEVEPDIAPWVRAKLLVNLGGIAIALSDAPPEELVTAAEDEARAVFDAAGEACIPADVFRARIGPLRAEPVDGRARVGGSTRSALARGEPLETATLHGSIVSAGARLGVATPVNAGWIRAAERAVREKIAPGSLDAATVRAWVSAGA